MEKTIIKGTISHSDISGKVTSSDEKIGHVSTEEILKGIMAPTDNIVGAISLSTDVRTVKQVHSATTSEWNSQKDLIGVYGDIYIYTDYQTIELEDGTKQTIPGLKIGDGNAYLIDKPFIDAAFQQHILDRIIHVTPEEREFWNNKVRCYQSEINGEELIFTTN